MLKFLTPSAGYRWVDRYRNEIMREDSVVGAREKRSRERKGWWVGVPRGWQVREIGKNDATMFNILQSIEGLIGKLRKRGGRREASTRCSPINCSVVVGRYRLLYWSYRGCAGFASRLWDIKRKKLPGVSGMNSGLFCFITPCLETKYEFKDIEI